MKTTIFTILLALTSLFMIGCETDTADVLIIDEVPQPPQNVYSITGDGEVYIYFTEPYMDDIDYYDIYRSYTDDFVNVTPTYVGFVNALPNPNLAYEYVNNFTDVSAVNGQTYYYRIKAVDEAGQESDFSAGEVFDTPRPEGTVTLVDVAVSKNNSGLILDTVLFIVADDNPLADVYVDSDINNVLYLNTTFQGVDIQDMGYQSSFDSVSVAPTEGWSNNGWVELIVGHTYVVWDDDLFFAKLRVQSIVGSSVNFRWAFQLDADNPELVQPRFNAQKPIHVNYIAKRSITNVQ